MKKNFAFGIIFGILLIVGGYLATAISIVAIYTNGIQTDLGVLNLPVGTHLGQGFEGKVAILTQGAYIDVGQGPVWYEEGTEIDCEPEPGYPDPCDTG